MQQMLAALHHRGPDDRHFISGDAYTLGATRLSILDLAGGRQPMTNETGEIVAAQNGEIYNYPELYQRLTAGGHHLRTTCDTECLPHLYEEHGVDLASHIDGMFAVSLWDDRRKLGFLARDRVGKKPLYYFQRGKALYYASEIKALLCVPGFERRINPEALHHFLSYKHVPDVYKRQAQVFGRFFAPHTAYCCWRRFGGPIGMGVASFSANAGEMCIRDRSDSE